MGCEISLVWDFDHKISGYVGGTLRMCAYLDGFIVDVFGAA
jgi:hypothetical protein